MALVSGKDKEKDTKDTNEAIDEIIGLDNDTSNEESVKESVKETKEKTTTKEDTDKVVSQDPERLKALDLAVGEIQKKFGKGSVMKLGAGAIAEIDSIPTGILSLDVALGIKGWPRGRIIEIFGPESSGKTTLSLHAIAATQATGGSVAFIDAEHALDAVYAQKLGVNTDDLLISQPDTGEQALEIAETLIRSSAIDMVVVDSVAALVPRAEIEGDMGDAQMGLQARLMSQAMRKLSGAINKTNACMIFINQVREKIGVYFGCFDYDSRVVFADGSTEKIGKIVKDKIDKPILTLTNDGLILPGKITNWYDNGEVDEFIHFVVAKGEGNGKCQFRVTSNHLILTEDGEIPANQIKVGDKVCRKELWQLNDDQFQVVLGSLYGDGHLKDNNGVNKSTNKYSAPILAIHHGEKQREYCEWKRNIFNDMANDVLDNNCFYTKPLPEFRNFNYWEWISKLNLLGLAIIYMDDGSARLNTKEGHRCFIYKKWDKKHLQMLHDKIEELTEAKGSISEKYGRITYCTNQFRMLSMKIARYVQYVPSMTYKLHPDSLDKPVVEMNRNTHVRMELGLGEVIKKETKPSKRYKKHRYDLEIDKHHRYCVDGVFVHNSPETTTGGRALKFYSSIRIDIRRTGAIKEGSEVIGNQTKIKIVKNKLAPPFKEAQVSIIYGEGIDKYRDLIDIALSRNVLSRSGSWYNLGDERLGQGTGKVAELMKNDPNLFDRIKEMTVQKM